MHLALHLSLGILKKAAIVFGVLLALAAFLFLLNAYRLRSWYGPPISGTGTLYYNGANDGWWYVRSDDGQVYEISTDSFFPSEFQVNGLKVEFIGYPYPDGDAVHGYSEYITLVDINKIY